MLSVHDLPYLTHDVPGIGGVIKARPEDFLVEEVPLYEAGGSGTHVYFQIEKKGLPTMQAIQEIARALGRGPRDIGYAGLKDADAVARQWLSVEHIDPAKVEAITLPRLRVVAVSRHTNKLKLGHLKGNRFTIRLRQVNPLRIVDAESTLARLSRRGVPNFFGPQRFGLRGDTWEIGRAVLRGDYDEALAVMVGRPGPHDRGPVLEARQRFDRGDYDKAADAWPYLFRNEKRVCRAMAKSRGNSRKSFNAIDRQVKRFYQSAYQSILFNQIVAQRINDLDQLMPGDLAWRHPQGAVFRVEDVAVEQPRCDAFEISPTGPLFGHRMSEPTGEPGAMERLLIELEGLKPEDWRDETGHRIPGGRRPLRFRPQEAAIEAGEDEVGDFIEVRFFLESGCYATTVLREICKATAGVTGPPEEAEQ